MVSEPRWLLPLGRFGPRLAPGVSALDLGPPPAGLEVRRGFVAGGLAHLDVVHHRLDARRFGHPRRRAFVLNDTGSTLPIGDPALHFDLETVFADLRFREFRLDGALDHRVRLDRKS